MALALREFIPQVVQAVEPWVSDTDLEKGTAWNATIAAKLREAGAGIVCVTPENQREPWLLFEAGALSVVKGNLVCPYLVDLEKREVKGPLASFQLTDSIESETRRMLQHINVRTNEPIAEETLHAVYEKMWPDFEKILADVCVSVAPKPEKRSTRDLLSELLNLVRAQSRQIDTLGANMNKATGSGAGFIPPTTQLFSPHLQPSTGTVGPLTAAEEEKESDGG